MKILSKAKQIGLVILIIANMVVLLGQIWPEGVPPFARTVNIIFLLITLLFFIISLVRNKK